MTRGKETGPLESPFRRLSINPGPKGKLDHEFRGLFEIMTGGFPEGAKRHFELLKRIPEGYEYFDKVPKEDAEKWIQEGSDFIAIDGPLFNQDGEPVEGKVALARMIVPRNSS